jgi:CheY-like chemotaxis protein
MKKLGEVYVVDDDRIYTYLLNRQVDNMDFCSSLRFFDHGGEALDALYALRDEPEKLPDLILLDINMPVCNGWQFLDGFTGLSLKKNIPVDIVSSSVTDAEQQRAIKHPNVGDFYNKPLSIKTLTTILQAAR